jgi:predicted nucleic acid-binding protein
MSSSCICLDRFYEKTINLYKLLMKQRIYIDTSVFGGYFDTEFADFTVPFFERLQNGEFILLYSNVTQEEIENAPEKVKNLVKNLKAEFTEFIETTSDTIDLATEYITEKVVGQTSYADCLHIALATINKADFLINWNFKHIVNVQNIRGYNSINIKNGYKQLEIRSPRDFMNYEDN